VPSDYQTAVTSINLGKPLVQSEPNSKIALEIRRIAQTLSTGAPSLTEEAKPRRALWNSIFKRSSSQPQFELQTSMEKV